MLVIDVLRKARDKIDKPSKWCMYWWESMDGKRLGTDGAIWWAAGGDKDLEKQAFRALAEVSGINPMWSDYDRVCFIYKHREVMSMFDKAIEAIIDKEVNNESL